ncbi:MAG TPA: universal stress protein [Thermomicrobiales bacterium]|nr:hypothetical protein [Chloroflexota bacterium]HQZ89011.1 universal stress protein [Thermomicrobiales bacterium]HRA31917.1 universal stress protein [Thermomicrobiales bacterium]
MKRILIPLDGSTLAEAALPFGASIARATGATIEVVHIIEAPALIDLPTSQLIPDPTRVHAYLHDTAERVIPGVAVESWVRAGDAVDELISHAAEQPESMIVMATRGRGGLGRLVLGSVADKVVRLSTTPVGLVRPVEGEAVGAADIRSIAVALDGSETAEQGLAIAVDFAKTAGAALHLIEVVEPVWASPYIAASPDMLAVNVNQLTELQMLAEDDARTYLGATAERLRAETPGMSVDWAMRVGRAAEEIDRVAVEANADLIVVTSHGRSGIRRFVLGSVTTGLTQIASRPLIIVPATTAQDADE